MVEPMAEPLAESMAEPMVVSASNLSTPIAGVELILGGQKSGKSRRAEMLAAAWLAGVDGQGQPRRATLVATAQPWDAEMQHRIARHQADRAQRAPGMATVEEPLALADTIARLSAPQHLLVVDCLTLWLTNWLMPPGTDELAGMAESTKSAELAEPAAQRCTAVFDSEFKEKSAPSLDIKALFATVVSALQAAPGPVVLVGNEIGLGVIPMGAEVRRFVDTLGQLNQAVAANSQRVVMMVAGLPLGVKT